MLDAHAAVASLVASGGRRPNPSEIRLTGGERRDLRRLIRRHTAAQRDVLRARIVLLAGKGLSNAAIARKLSCDVKTVRKWREQYVLNRSHGLNDAPRSGRPAIFTSEIKHQAFAMVVSDPPFPFAKWTVDLLCTEMIGRGMVPAISRETLSYWLRKAKIKPHRTRSWLNSKDPNFQEKMKRIVDLYINPPADGVVISIDELTGLQALERKYPTQVTRNGVRKYEFEYIRHGTVKMIASFEVQTGRVRSKFVASNNSDAFIEFLQPLEKIHPTGKIYIILDNGSSHVSKKTKAYFRDHPRLVPVYTPTHASWLNQIEIWFSALKRRSLSGVSFKSTAELMARIEAYIKHHNIALARPYAWSYTGQPLV